MIRKVEKLVITFYTTTDAMAMEAACKEEQADGRLIPVPRQISAGCGLAWSAQTTSEGSLMKIMESKGITAQGIYRCMV